MSKKRLFVQRVSRDGHVFLLWTRCLTVNKSLTSVEKGRIDKSPSSPKASTGQRQKRIPEGEQERSDAFAFSTLLGLILTLKKASKKCPSVKTTSVKTEPSAFWLDRVTIRVRLKLGLGRGLGVSLGLQLVLGLRLRLDTVRVTHLWQ